MKTGKGRRARRHLKRRRNPVNWERQATWHEAEGSRTIGLRPPHRPYLTVASQDIARAEIPQTLCRELTDAGFKSAKFRAIRRDSRCVIERILEQECYLNRIKPHTISAETKREIEAILTHIAKRKPTRPRYPFQCPQ